MPIRVVLAKPGLDGHDRGIKVVGRALRDAGFEVVYTGRHQTPEQIVRTVVQEDADVLGLSILSGAHVSLVADVRDLMISSGVGDVRVVLGGTIPADDFGELRRLGVEQIFTPGTNLSDVVRFFAETTSR
jgi:methylmalonyl-CoA mutase, C-terminal domain